MAFWDLKRALLHWSVKDGSLRLSLKKNKTVKVWCRPGGLCALKANRPDSGLCMVNLHGDFYHELNVETLLLTTIKHACASACERRGSPRSERERRALSMCHALCASAFPHYELIETLKKHHFHHHELDDCNLKSGTRIHIQTTLRV